MISGNWMTKRKKKIIIISTGGTIAMVKKVGLLFRMTRGMHLLQTYPNFTISPMWSFTNSHNIPSPYMTPNCMFELARR